ncbi:MAG TPA: ROK family transcriptional regulator [Pseudonocardiaceae bacterium]
MSMPPDAFTAIHQRGARGIPVSRRGASAGLVLRAILHHGPIARSKIARRTGLSAAAVTGHVAELAGLGLVRELPETAGPRGLGRPHVPIELDTERQLIGGVHVGVPAATVALMNLRGEIVASERIPHRRPDPLPILEHAAMVLRELLAACPGDAVPVGLGVATGGWVDPDSGVLVEHPVLGWRDVPVGRILTTQTGFPVAVDAHSRALLGAECLFGRARDQTSVLHLFVGNVVDAAFAIDGTVNHGPRSAAGAIAHLPVEGSDDVCGCGRVGCLQATVSEPTLVRKALRQGIIREPVFRELMRTAENGDPRAKVLFTERATLVGRAAASMIDMLNPQLTIVADPGLRLFPESIALLRAEVRARSQVCGDVENTVLATTFGGRALAVAACSAMANELFADPLGTLAMPAPGIL